MNLRLIQVHTFFLAPASPLLQGCAQKRLPALDHFLPKSCGWHLEPLLLFTGPRGPRDIACRKMDSLHPPQTKNQERKGYPELGAL